MAETTFTIGAEASCTDCVCGDVIRVVVDPIARSVTHLVVEPKHRGGLGRLVPLELVDASNGEIRLGCTAADFEKLERAEDTRFLPGTIGSLGYGPDQVMFWPYYGIGAGNVSEPVTYDTVPDGDVTVRRGEHVHATDGDIGRVQGLVMDAGDRHITHVLLQEGHLWGRRQVAIPIAAVSEVREGIRLNLTKQEVGDLRPVTVEQLNG